MSEITLEKIDIVRERTGASYSEAKEALEACGGNVVDALIYLEGQKEPPVDNMFSSKEEFFDWMKLQARRDTSVVSRGVTAKLTKVHLAGTALVPKQGFRFRRKEKTDR